MFRAGLNISSRFHPDEECVLFEGDCLELLRAMPDETVQLIFTSPPYNIGKSYEKKSGLDEYITFQEHIIGECVRCLRASGSICWQVGNYVEKGEIIPLDTILYPVFARHGLKMRNRVVWHFEHGLHCSRRFSGRYETVIWFTKTDDYIFDLDAVRVPQKYPGKKHFKGPNAGKPSCNPLGKNPGDVWAIPNVKSNHVEKTCHPCQFPVELAERFVLSMSCAGDWVCDPFAGVGSTLIAAVRHGRKAVGAEILTEYAALARERILAEAAGTLRTRPMERPVYDPSSGKGSLPKESGEKRGASAQLPLFPTRVCIKNAVA